jgi:hypothetical protein
MIQFARRLGSSEALTIYSNGVVFERSDKEYVVVL